MALTLTLYYRVMGGGTGVTWSPGPSSGFALTFHVVVLQKAEENAEGGESALGPDGEVREMASLFTVVC